LDEKEGEPEVACTGGEMTLASDAVAMGIEAVGMDRILVEEDVDFTLGREGKAKERLIGRMLCISLRCLD
jgi:hypothetical protein